MHYPQSIKIQRADIAFFLFILVAHENTTNSNVIGTWHELFCIFHNHITILSYDLLNTITIVFWLVVLAGAAEKVQTTTDANLFKTKSCLEKPYRCPHPKIEFFLYTRRTQKKPEKIDVLDPEAFYYTHYNRAHPTKIIIHGFGESNIIQLVFIKRALNDTTICMDFRWWKKFITESWYTWSVFQAWWLQYLHRGLWTSRERAMLESNGMVAAVWSVMHFTIGQIRRRTSAWCAAR